MKLPFSNTTESIFQNLKIRIFDIKILDHRSFVINIFEYIIFVAKTFFLFRPKFWKGNLAFQTSPLLSNESIHFPSERQCNTCNTCCIVASLDNSLWLQSHFANGGGAAFNFCCKCTWLAGYIWARLPPYHSFYKFFQKDKYSL